MHNHPGPPPSRGPPPNTLLHQHPPHSKASNTPIPDRPPPPQLTSCLTVDNARSGYIHPRLVNGLPFVQHRLPTTFPATTWAEPLKPAQTSPPCAPIASPP
ncbi:hypothetical protein NMY22_g19680 [Coprinellus aureogranulatus]|nr:hypothetical protein NMY22_g19680 [Coprinellus aureogranulatus]